MQVIFKKEEVIQLLDKQRVRGNKIGFVPTMGCIHDGHLSLLRAAKDNSDFTVVSIFVNPTQFNDPKDLENYPRVLDEDLKKVKNVGADLVFCPSEEEIYTQKPTLKISFGRLESHLEGANRPGHFNGVGIVICKLFNIVKPDFAFFGQKDYQQVLIIKQLVEDLGFNTKIIMTSIIREKDGLAMSSRNTLLNKEERKEASLLFKVLSQIKKEFIEGKPVDEVIEKGRNTIQQSSFELEYLEIRNASNLEPLNGKNFSGDMIVCVAAKLGSVRLIDNQLLFSR